MATEVLELTTVEMYIHELPKATRLEDIVLKDKEKAVFICYNTEDINL